MFRIAAVCIACSLVSGCMSFGGAYPLNWAEPIEVENDGCPIIDGEFQNAGAMFHEQSEGSYVEEPISLANLLSGWADPADKRLDFSTFDPATDVHETVNLQLAGETLRVRAKRTDGESRTFDIPVRHRCEDSLMNLVPNWNADTTVLFSIVDRSSLQLGRATDGSLLMHSKNAGGLFLMYMPLVGGSDQRWIRFPATEPMPSGAGSLSASN